MPNPQALIETHPVNRLNSVHSPPITVEGSSPMSHNSTEKATSTHMTHLERLTAVIESRKPESGGDAEKSYVARLFSKGPDAFLKKIGEEATEVVMAAKDLEQQASEARQKAFIGEMADLWFHSMVALAHFGMSFEDVVQELARREGLSGLEEKALRKAISREKEQSPDA